jgi:hypothetical protein
VGEVLGQAGVGARGARVGLHAQGDGLDVEVAADDDPAVAVGSVAVQRGQAQPRVGAEGEGVVGEGALVDEGLVEKRRGMGLYVTTGAKATLLQGERERFLTSEWPKVRARIARLGLSATELLAAASPDTQEQDR